MNRASKDNAPLALQDTSNNQPARVKARGLVSRYWGLDWSEYHTL
jgi:hypothetical protein